MKPPDRPSYARWGCVSVAMAVGILAAANGAGWIDLPWVWFFLPVWLLFIVGAVLTGAFVVGMWVWLVLVAVWVVIRAVARCLYHAASFLFRALAVRCARRRRSR